MSVSYSDAQLLSSSKPTSSPQQSRCRCPTKNPLQHCERSRCCVRSSLLDSEHAVDIRASFELVQTVASMPGFGGEPASPWHRPTASIPAMEIAMFRHVACTALLLGGLLAGSTAARAESRLALVIGQSAYRSVTPLPNPANDAKAMAQLLRDSGFDVTSTADLSQKDKNREVCEFAAKVAK